MSDLEKKTIWFFIVFSAQDEEAPKEVEPEPKKKNKKKKGKIKSSKSKSEIKDHNP